MITVGINIEIKDVLCYVSKLISDCKLLKVNVGKSLSKLYFVDLRVLLARLRHLIIIRIDSVYICAQ